MGLRKTKFVNGEFYHVFNRGVDKRIIFSGKQDIDRFMQGMVEFNDVEPIGSIYENSFRQLGSPASKLAEGDSISVSTVSTSTPIQKQPKPLVRFISYCLNPNHYHFLVEQIADKGIEKIMQRIGTGYTKYFNNKYNRVGSLFQGKFKSVHVNSNEYLLHLSAYVNLNDQVHQLGSSASKLVKSKSSWEEYTRGVGSNVGSGHSGICAKEIILGQFKNKREYKEFALESLKTIRQRKEELKGIQEFLLE